MGETLDIPGIGRHLTLRALRAEDLGQAISMTLYEEWCMSLCEMAMWHQAYQNSRMGLFLDDGTLISQICLTPVTEDSVCLSQYITSKPYRGLGIGKRMFERAVKLAAGRTVVLESVPSMCNMYAKLGFAHENPGTFLYCGKLKKSYGSNEVVIQNSPELLDLKPIVNKVCPSDIGKLCDYDFKISHSNRRKFLTLLFNSPSYITLTAKHPHSQDICGYIVMTLDHPGKVYKMQYRGFGFYADNSTVAKELLGQMLLRYLPVDAVFWLYGPVVNSGCKEVYSEVCDELDPGAAAEIRMTHGGGLPSYLAWDSIYGLMINCTYV